MTWCPSFARSSIRDSIYRAVCGLKHQTAGVHPKLLQEPACFIPLSKTLAHPDLLQHHSYDPDRISEIPWHLDVPPRDPWTSVVAVWAQGQSTSLTLICGVDLSSAFVADPKVIVCTVVGDLAPLVTGTVFWPMAEDSFWHVELMEAEVTGRPD